MKSNQTQPTVTEMANTNMTKAAPGAVTKAAPNPVATIASFFEQQRPELEKACGKMMRPDRLIKVAMNCISRTPGLQKCTPFSLYRCLLTAAELGLEAGGALGQLYLVPYGAEATAIIGYRGLIDLARRAGTLAQIEAHVVHKGDAFKVSFGLAPVLEHTPDLSAAPGDPVAVYMVARLKDGGVHTEVMSITEINRIRDTKSKAGKSGPWVSDYEEMCKKTVVRRGLKYIPMSSEMAKAFESEDEDDNGLSNIPSSVVAPPAQPRQQQGVAAPQPEDAEFVEEHDPVTGEVAEQPAAEPVKAGAPQPGTDEFAEGIAAEIGMSETMKDLMQLHSSIKDCPEPRQQGLSEAFQAKRRELVAKGMK